MRTGGTNRTGQTFVVMAGLTVIPVLAFATLFAGCRSPAGDASDGIPKRTPRVQLTEELALGGGDSDAVFAMVGDVISDASGNILVGDLRESTVSILDSTGALRFALGGRGSAPGQLSVLRGFVVREDSVLLFDMQKYVVFDGRTGELAATIPLPGGTTGSFAPLGAGVASAGTGSGVGVIGAYTDYTKAIDRSDPGYDVVRLADGELGPPLWHGSNVEFVSYIGENRGPVYQAKPQGRNSHCVVGSDAVYCAENDSLEIDVLSLRGAGERRLSIPFEPLGVTTADRAKWLDAVQGEEMKAAFEPPARWRALEDLLIDDVGRLWLNVRVSRDDSIHTWWIVDPAAAESGRYVAYVEVASSVELRSIRGSKIYARVTRQSGEQEVVRYRFVY